MRVGRAAAHPANALGIEPSRHRFGDGPGTLPVTNNPSWTTPHSLAGLTTQAGSVSVWSIHYGSGVTDCPYVLDMHILYWYDACMRTEKRVASERRAGHKYLQGLRKKAFDAIGHKCDRCGMDDPRCLQIDHRDGGGTKELGGMSRPAYYRLVMAEPHRYQPLCANCNWIKRHELREVAGTPRY